MVELIISNPTALLIAVVAGIDALFLFVRWLNSSNGQALPGALARTVLSIVYLRIFLFEQVLSLDERRFIVRGAILFVVFTELWVHGWLWFQHYLNRRRLNGGSANANTATRT